MDEDGATRGDVANSTASGRSHLHVSDLRDTAHCGKCDDVTPDYYAFLRSSTTSARPAASPAFLTSITFSSALKEGMTLEETSSRSVEPATKESISEGIVLPYWNTLGRGAPMSWLISGRG